MLRGSLFCVRGCDDFWAGARFFLRRGLIFVSGRVKMFFGQERFFDLVRRLKVGWFRLRFWIGLVGIFNVQAEV